MAESQTELAFTNFLRSAIEPLPHGLSDALLNTTPIKSIKPKKFEINIKMAGTYSPRPVS